MTTYPKAEGIAERITLPVVPCKVTQELYGYTTWLLDTKAATSALLRAGLFCDTPEFDAAMQVLEARTTAIA